MYTVICLQNIYVVFILTALMAVMFFHVLIETFYISVNFSYVILKILNFVDDRVSHILNIKEKKNYKQVLKINNKNVELNVVIRKLFVQL